MASRGSRRAPGRGDGVDSVRGWGLASLVVVAVACLARLPALGTWWCLDDWGQLARACGLAPGGGGFPARWLSQHLWWSLTWPILGLHAGAHAALRLILHALAAATVVCIARRAGLGPAGGLVAGLLFAATPIASTPLFWASGVQELLSGLLALLAVERWLAGDRLSLLLAGLFGIGSMLSKETGLGLPLLFAGLLGLRAGPRGGDRRWGWLVVCALLVVAASEALLVARHFATGANDRYSLAGGLVPLGNLGKFGWWLMTPGPVFTGQVTWALAGWGLAAFAAWAVWGVFAWRRGRPLPALALAAALLGLAPALPLVHQAKPYMAYPAAAAAALTLGELVKSRRPLAWLPALGGAVAAAVWGLVGMHFWIDNRAADGLPADSVVRAARTARETAEFIGSRLPAGGLARGTALVVFQQPLRPDAIVRVERLGDTAVVPTPRHTALEGATGLSVIAGTGVPARWTASLLDVPASAFVFCESGTGLEAWGPTGTALLYAAAVDILGGNDEPARAELLRAAALGEDLGRFHYDQKAIGVPAPVLLRKARAFRDRLAVAAMGGNAEAARAMALLDVLAARLAAP